MNLTNIINKLRIKYISELNRKELSKILEIRNEDNVRKNMFSKHLITQEEHTIWSENQKNSKHDFFYGVLYADQLIGGLGLYNTNKKNENSDWGFYIATEVKVNGLGAALEFKAIKFFFENFEIDKLICFVYNHNSEVIRLHKKFGFLEISCDDSTVLKSKNIATKDLTCLCLPKVFWMTKEKEMLKKYFN